MIARRILLAATIGALPLAVVASVATAAPSVSSNLAISAVTQTTATVDGSVDSALVAAYHLEYGPTTSYGSSAPDPEGQKDPFVCPAPTAVEPQGPEFVPPWFSGDCIAGRPSTRP